eukprot:15802429-Heterocapsa_arctica.AAC.1
MDMEKLFGKDLDMGFPRATEASWAGGALHLNMLAMFCIIDCKIHEERRKRTATTTVLKVDLHVGNKDMKLGDS